MSDEGGKVTIDSRGNLRGMRASANNQVIGHSPVISANKTNKPHLSNLLKSQGPPASVYSNEQLSNNQARGNL